MERTGFLNEFIIISGSVYAADKVLDESSEQKIARASRDMLLSFFKDVARSNDVKSILEIENAALLLELKHRANSREEVNSINAALSQLQDAQKSFVIVQNHEAYRPCAATYSSRQKEAGLPMDGFREFIKSHTTRLTNRLSAPLSVPEKNLLRQRKENLQVAKGVYTELQREALGLPSPKEKDLGLER